MPEKIFITGACGQIGTELTTALKIKHGVDAVITSDLHKSNHPVFSTGKHYMLDILDKEQLTQIIRNEQIHTIYHLAAILSAKGEKEPLYAWDVNMHGYFNIIDAAIKCKVSKIFWPSSIAVFGHNSPKHLTPQHTITEPATVYGISKLAGESWCNYFYHKHGLDIRSLRYPGLISYKSPPGGGTTDYAVDIFYKAIKNEVFECFLNKDTCLPMMYMSDAIRATIELMEAPTQNIKVRTSYNISAFSFTPDELTKSIQYHFPDFRVIYKPDFRQEIADSWPESIDDSAAKNHWKWSPEYNLESMVETMLENLTIKLNA